MPPEDLLPLGDEPELTATTWIEIHILDEDNQPCANEYFELKLSDGRSHTGQTNEHGILRYDGIPEGTCSLWLSGPSKSSWMQE